MTKISWGGGGVVNTSHISLFPTHHVLEFILFDYIYFLFLFFCVCFEALRDFLKKNFFSSISGDESHLCHLEIGSCELLYNYGEGLQRIDVLVGRMFLIWTFLTYIYVVLQ